MSQELTINLHQTQNLPLRDGHPSPARGGLFGPAWRLLPYSRVLSILLLSMFAVISGAWGQGTITHLSGPISVLKADGSRVEGASGLVLAVGDTVVSGAAGFARIEMTDKAELVVRPNTQLKIERYTFEVDRPSADDSVLSVLKGGLRTVTGLIGKRGKQDAYQLKTTTATIGIRGTQFDMRLCAGDCGALADGTYVKTTRGSIILSTLAAPAVPESATIPGLILTAGQVGFVPPSDVPVLLPRDPGIGFTPPPTIPKLDENKREEQPQTTPGTGTGTGTGSTSGAAPADVSGDTPDDLACEVQ